MAFDPFTAGEELLNGFGSQLLARIWPDPAQRAQGELALAKMKQDGDLARLVQESDLSKAQLAVNQAEAGSASLFIAGWRPFIGWTCGVELAGQFVVQCAIAIVNLVHGQPASVDISFGQGLLMALLGAPAVIGRTVEKLKKASATEPDH
jgi:hypothetical protein